MPFYYPEKRASLLAIIGFIHRRHPFQTFCHFYDPQQWRDEQQEACFAAHIMPHHKKAALLM